MPDPRLKLLADNIRKCIGSSVYSPAEVARALSVDKSAISRWMNGQRTPTVQNLIELAHLLEVEVTELWNGEEALPATPEQRLMVDLMGKMTAEQQETFLAMAKTLIKSIES